MAISSTNALIGHTDWYATIEVTTSPYATVRCGGQITYANEYGSATIRVYTAGYHTVSAELDGRSNEGQVYVYNAESYYISLPLSATIRAYAPVGTVVTCDGNTQTVTGSYVEFTVYSTGTYDVVGVKDGSTKTNSVVVSSLGNTYSTTFVFDADLNIYTNPGADVIFDGLRVTATNGKATFKFGSADTYKITIIYNGNAKVKDVVLSSVVNTDVDIYVVPEAYQQVEYLGVPNTGYINTEFYPTQNTELTIKASHDGSTYSSGDLGQIGTCRWTGNPFWSFGIYPRNINSGASTGATTFFYGTYYSSGGHTGYIILNDAVNTTDVFEYNLGLTSVSVKNVTTGSVKSASITRNQTFTSTQPLWLGAFNNQGSRLSVNYGTHIYSASIKENGNTVRYFIPCKRVSDNVLGMWDAINDVFYTNSGTGTFTAGQTIELPSEYQQVEYLQGSGTQYIDTGVNNTTGVSQLNIKAKFEVQSSSVTMAGVWGWANRDATTLANDLGFNCVQLSSGRPNFFHYFFTVSTTQISPQLLYHNTVYDLECEYANNISKVTCNNQTQTYSNTTDTKYITNNIYLFATNDVKAVTGKFVGKIYSCSIELNNAVVRNFVPCYRKSDSVAGMYDTVNDVFYTNAGTGTFTVGSDVNTTYYLPSEYTYRKYIASTSDKTQYLNLGETGTNTSGMLIKIYDELDGVKDNIYAGARAVSNGRFIIGGNKSTATSTDYAYYGWNTINRLEDPPINATKTLRTFSMNYLNNRKECYDNTKVYDLNQTLVQTTPNLYAFCEDNIGTVRYPSWCRLYYIILTSGTSISNIFIPCTDSNNVHGMYDVIKGNFKTNAGSGSFVYGD